MSCQCEKALVSSGKVVKPLTDYINLLTKTGYVRQRSVKHLLVMLFILDMVENMPSCISESDYKIMQRALRNMEGQDCLLPYSLYCTNKITIGSMRCGPAGDFNEDFNEDFYVFKP